MKKISEMFAECSSISREKRIMSIDGCIKHISSAESYSPVLEKLESCKKNVGKKMCSSPGCEGIFLPANITKCWQCKQANLTTLSEAMCQNTFFNSPDGTKVAEKRYAVDKLMNPCNTQNMDGEKVSPGLPIFHAPTTMEKCGNILNELCNRFNVKPFAKDGNRSNIIVGCDNCPFPLINKLATNTFLHMNCQENIYAENEDAIKAHEEECNKSVCSETVTSESLSRNDVKSFMIGRDSWKRTFGCVLLHSGDLHIEINSGKYILNKLLKPLCGKDLAEVFGRRSEKSFQYFYSGNV